jgi:hypothetical protein
VIKKHFRPNGLPTVVIAFLSAIALRADTTYPPPSTGPNSPRLIGAFAADPGLFPIYDYYRALTNTEIDTVLNLVNYPFSPFSTLPGSQNQQFRGLSWRYRVQASI